MFACMSPAFALFSSFGQRSEFSGRKSPLCQRSLRWVQLHLELKLVAGVIEWSLIHRSQVYKVPIFWKFTSPDSGSALFPGCHMGGKCHWGWWTLKKCFKLMTWVIRFWLSLWLNVPDVTIVFEQFPFTIQLHEMGKIFKNKIGSRFGSAVRSLPEAFV